MLGFSQAYSEKEVNQPTVQDVKSQLPSLLSDQVELDSALEETFAQAQPQSGAPSTPSSIRQSTTPSATPRSYAVPPSSNRANATPPPASAGAGQAAPATRPIYPPAQYPPQVIQAPVVPPPPPPPLGSEKSPYAFHSFRLSYMQSDRVLALLKSVGYSTIEYSASRGESINESIFNAVTGPSKYPLVVKLLDSAKTSLMQPPMDGGRSLSGGAGLGGTYLHSSTTGAPEQRLLILYEKKFPEQLNGLLNLLRNEIDVPARQIVIEALVVEINTKKAREVGFNYNLTGKRGSTNLNTDSGGTQSFNSNEESFFSIQNKYAGNYIDSTTGLTTPYTNNIWTRTVPLGFTATLDAFISDGTANVLSNPTILVLDGRQALIRIGTQFLLMGIIIMK